MKVSKVYGLDDVPVFAPEPSARVDLACRTPPAPLARHFLDLAVQLQNSIEQ